MKRVWSTRAAAVSLLKRSGRTLFARMATDVPERLELALVTRVARPPEGDGWLHEVKFDGYRIMARMDAVGGVRLITRNGNDWTARAPGVVASIEALKLRNAVFDGEAVLFHSDGRPNFHGLRGRAGARQIAYVAFDALFMGGRDLRGAALVGRQRELAAAVPPERRNAWLYMSESFDASGSAVLAAASKLGVEGIVSKRRGRPYPAGRTRDWVKTLNQAYRRT